MSAATALVAAVEAAGGAVPDPAHVRCRTHGEGVTGTPESVVEWLTWHLHPGSGSHDFARGPAAGCAEPGAHDPGCACGRTPTGGAAT